MKTYELAVVGGGIAGYTAALTAKNLLLDYIWFGEEGFGKLSSAEKVTNFPAAFGSGKDLVAALNAQMGLENLHLTPKRIDGIYAGAPFTLTAGEEKFLARSVILATGVERRGSFAGEREFLGRGLSYCAVCDGALYRGKKIAAILSSPKYEEEARFLARFAAEVLCVCLYSPEGFSGERLTVVQDLPVAVEGKARVEELILRGGRFAVDGVFVLKDSVPPEALVFGLPTEGGHVRTDRAMQTEIKSLFAAGDVTGRPYQYAKAAGEGCVAAHSAAAFLRENGKI